MRVIIFMSLVTFGGCYPASVSNTEPAKIDPEYENEKRFPNGTVVGQYEYTDKEGNPIHVKYYASDSGYGVELKSLKIFNGKDESVVSPAAIDSILKSTNPTFKAASELLDTVMRYQNNIPNGKVNDKAELPVSKMDSVENSEYDVLMRKEFATPKRCNKQRVTVYNFHKEKRNAENAYTPHADNEKYCQRV